MSYEARMRDAEDDNMNDGDRAVPSDYAFAIVQEADAIIAAKNAEVAKLREELVEARKLIERLIPAATNCETEEALRGDPAASAAWGLEVESARAFLARKEAK